mmetsp:Transcript_54421/g.170995  ORF Transcript_54421/g.170995 Transcript_54421/m.170995 type:complete len:272 (+) Transcript_54421:602-1417(+)
MHAVVTHVGLGLQAQLPPVREDLAAQGVPRRLLGVGRPEDLAAEVLPGELALVPLHGVVVDAPPGRRELAAHGHEEAVEHVQRRVPWELHQPAVEAAAELHQLAALLGGRPSRVQLIRRAAQPLARVHGVEDHALCERVVPGKAKGLLELVLGDVQLRGLQDRGLRRDGIVVLVDELLLVDDLRRQVPLPGDLEALGRQLLAHERVRLRGYCMRLHKNEGGIPGFAGLRVVVGCPSEGAHTHDSCDHTVHLPGGTTQRAQSKRPGPRIATG